MHARDLKWWWRIICRPNFWFQAMACVHIRAFLGTGGGSWEGRFRKGDALQADAGWRRGGLRRQDAEARAIQPRPGCEDVHQRGHHPEKDTSPVRTKNLLPKTLTSSRGTSPSKWSSTRASNLLIPLFISLIVAILLSCHQKGRPLHMGSSCAP